MPEVFCRILNRNVDGGYCAFICELPDGEKKIVFNPVRGIFTGCRFSSEFSHKVPLNSWKIKTLESWKSDNTEKSLLKDQIVK
ncbi:MAG: hypothetical protein ACUVXA_12455 [Candidatus Jordarchaeum sp.]|uniref:hypothetical protein n=1 Tax=Candidatus Jordarchaeum sp. TaxID=2823881 RepID=UPI004049B543